MDIDSKIEKVGSVLYPFIMVVTYAAIAAAVMHVAHVPPGTHMRLYCIQLALLMMVSVINILFNWKKPLSRYFNMSVVVLYSIIIIYSIIYK